VRLLLCGLKSLPARNYFQAAKHGFAGTELLDTWG